MQRKNGSVGRSPGSFAECACWQIEETLVTGYLYFTQRVYQNGSAGLSEGFI